MTKLSDRVMCQCVCKGRTGHRNVPDSNPGLLTIDNLYMVLPVTDK